MKGKKTKGKQKINIRKVERDEDRLVTFSKRRNGIYTKLSELSILCGAEVGFLVYSGSGKPYTFGNQSLETVAQRFINGEGGSSSTVDANRKVELEEICKMYNSVVEEFDAEEARGMTSEAPVKEDHAWWRVDPEKMKEDEEAKQLLKKYEELYEKLFEVADKKNNGGDVASSSCTAINRND